MYIIVGGVASGGYALPVGRKAFQY